MSSLVSTDMLAEYADAGATWWLEGFNPGNTAADVVTLSLHRGAFEPTLSDEDQEQNPDRWCSQAAWGQECWQIVLKSGLPTYAWSWGTT